MFHFDLSRNNIIFALSMRRIALFLASVLLLLTACGESDRQRDQAKPIDTIPVMVMQIRKCSKFYTAEYQVHKIVTHDDKVELKGSFMQQKFNISVPMSARKIAIPIDARLKAYIDFSGFSERNIITHGDKIEIILPDPKVELTSSRINHGEIKKHVSLIRSNFTDAEMASYEKQGREAIIRSIPQTGIIDMARESAAHALMPMLMKMGYKDENITITFRKEFTTDDLPLLLDNNTIENGRQ